MTLIIASLLVFLATNVLPGNVATAVLGRNATPANVATLEHTLGLNHPLLERYFDWVVGLLHGNLGNSAVQIAQGATKAPISRLISAPLANSAILALITTALLFPISFILGTLAGLRAGRPTDHVLSGVALLFGALPEFVFGTFLILLFFSTLHWFPPVFTGTGSPLSHITGLVLPVFTLLGVTTAFGVRQIRAGLIEVMHQDYVTLAEINGLPRNRIVMRYALRNALAPAVQSLAQNVQYLLGGIIVVESLFNYPGIGLTLVNAVTMRDVTEVQAIAIVLAAAYIAINIAADLIVVFLVPKLRTSL